MDNLLNWLIPEIQRALKQIMQAVSDEAAHGDALKAVYGQEKENLLRIVNAVELASQGNSSLPVILLRLKDVLIVWQSSEAPASHADRQIFLHACQTVHEFTNAITQDPDYSELCLFATYSALSSLSGNPAHPADLWPQQSRQRTIETLLGVDAKTWFIAQARDKVSYTTEAAIEQTQLDLHQNVLSLVRSPQVEGNLKQQAINALDVLASTWVLNHQNDPTKVAIGGMFRLVLTSFSVGGIKLDVWLKRLLLNALKQFDNDEQEHLLSLSFFSYVGWQQSSKEALQRNTSPYPKLISDGSQWRPLKGATYDVILFGLIPPIKIDVLLRQIERTKVALSANSVQTEQHDRSIDEAAHELTALARHLVGFHATAEPLAYELHQIADGKQVVLTKRNVHIELATALLILEAMLGHPTVQSATDFELRFTEIARRLRATREGQIAGAFAPWMLSLQHDHAWHKTNAQLVGEVRARLVSMEQVFQARDFNKLEIEAMSLRSVARSMKWDSLAEAAQSMALQIRQELTTDKEALLASNLAAMGLFVDMQGNSRHSAEALFTFDDRSLQLKVQGRTLPDLLPMPKPSEITGQNSTEAAPQTAGAEMQELFLEEAAELLATAKAAHQALVAVPSDTEQAVVLRRAFHTLKGGARMVGMPTIADVAWQAEQKLNQLLSEKTAISTEVMTATEQAIISITQHVPLAQITSGNTVTALKTPQFAQPADWLDLPATKTIGDLTISLSLYNAYLNEADEWSRQLVSALSEWRIAPSLQLPNTTLVWAHALVGSSATVGFASLSQLAKAMELLIERVVEEGFTHPDLPSTLEASANDVCRLLHQFAAGFIKEPAPALLNQLDLLQRVPNTDSLSDSKQVEASDLTHTTSAEAALDDDLAAVFSEEFAVLLPHLGASMRSWLHNEHEELVNHEQRAEALRVLHTLKGSARLVGQQALAQQAHDLESSIESYSAAPSHAQRDALLEQYDRLSTIWLGGQNLVQPERVDTAAVHTAITDVLVQTPTPTPIPTPTKTVISSVTTATPAFSALPTGEVIRVKLGLIDRLVNQSGEILIARARLAAEAQRAQATLLDMTLQIGRLREQLRELDIQTESQLQSRQAQFSEQLQGFDPLELDRYTRAQELTRFMAEALSDMSTLQRSLQRSLNATEDDLAAQSRLAKDLQRHLLQARMVPFDSIAERLHRLVRMASQELSKTAQLSITGGSLELDRSVLERITPAFEHLLRNSIVHGIELPEQRSALGKNQTGQIRIGLVQNGSDVMVTVEDDGQGVNERAVRERAQTLDPEAALGRDAEQLIFMSGLSTAAQVSELAGRGIGMDVVRAQVLALGGRVEVKTQEGQGTVFKLMLPLTTAITQIVLVRSGTHVTAIPANLVQTVLRAKTSQTDVAEQSRVWPVGEQNYSFYRLNNLLNYPSEATVAGASGQQVQSVLLLTSASQTLALCVDEVLGNQEAVVKNLGPQLSQMPGLVGMTVLPSGQSVLIYNPIALATVYGIRATKLDDVIDPGSVAPDNLSTAVAAPLVMVVDDSITMRRVLQRLLLREGYRTTQAADGKQALDMLRVERPALVLSDVEMPRMDGFELLKQIRSSEKLQDLPVVMITSRIADKHRDHAKSLGANEYLGKPYPEEELLLLLRQYAGSVKA